MLRIRPHQIESMQDVLDRRDALLIAGRMRVALPHVAYAVTPEELLELLVVAVRRGRELGIATIEGCQALARLLVEVGPDCESLDELAAILRDSRIQPDIRPEVVLGIAPATEWRRRLESLRAQRA